MTRIPCIFSSGALSPGTVLPTLGHENYPSWVARVKPDRKLAALTGDLDHPFWNRDFCEAHAAPVLKRAELRGIPVRAAGVKCTEGNPT
jgi:hypothetical protein